MRRILLTLSLLAAVATPIAARAAAMDLITVTGPSGTFTFLVPASPVNPGQDTLDVPPAFFDLTNVPVTSPSGTSLDTVYFYDSALDGGGFQDKTLLGGAGLNLSGPQLFSGSFTNPTFILGSGILNPLDNSGNPIPPNFSFSIVSAPTAAATPEPSSLMLFGTGATGLLALYRRRRVQA